MDSRAWSRITFAVTSLTTAMNSTPLKTSSAPSLASIPTIPDSAPAKLTTKLAKKSTSEFPSLKAIIDLTGTIRVAFVSSSLRTLPPYHYGAY
ncbi:hypothetical protein H5410_013616 [Solanum commersonii]|uniref:Uncharacterized protein n=1 Tax=Solanum commersonii TaxID=4109 RepID=A0A9J5ZNQ4_SOLCO|nr:hypothetical protein H5410_013616 [Solanum commersonii]